MLVDRVFTCLEGVKLLGGHYPHRPSTTLKMMFNIDIDLNIHVLFRGMLQRTSIIIYHYILCPLYISSWQSYLQLHTLTHTHTHIRHNRTFTRVSHSTPENPAGANFISQHYLFYFLVFLHSPYCNNLYLLGSSEFLQRVGDQIQNHECS